MKKSYSALIAGLLVVGSSAIMADSGVLVHDKNGNAFFFSSDEVDYIEFLNDYEEGGDNISLTSNIKNLNEGDQLTATAVVTAQSTRGLILTDNAGSIFYFNNNVDIDTYQIGSVVEINGTVGKYGTGLQLTNSAKLKVKGTNTFRYPSAKTFTVDYVDEACKNSTLVLPTYGTLEGTLSISGTYYNIILPATSNTGSFYAPTSDLSAKLISGKNYKFTGYYTGVTSGKYFYMVLTGVEEVGNPNQGGDDIPGTSTSGVPSEYTYPLSYVKLPDGTPQQVKEYTGFTVNFNKDNHTPNYVAWELTASETKGSASDANYWVDNTVEGCLSTDYAYNTYKYDRGHMCPKADSKWSTQSMKDCMVMTNMVPQPNNFNGGMWATLEGKERDNANKYGKIWIISGPVYYDIDQTYIGQAKARVPSACFKAFLYENGTNSKAIAFVMNNGTNSGNYSDHAMSIDKLEELLGYDLFSALPDDIEDAVEATFNISDWN